MLTPHSQTGPIDREGDSPQVLNQGSFIRGEHCPQKKKHKTSNNKTSKQNIKNNQTKQNINKHQNMKTYYPQQTIEPQNAAHTTDPGFRACPLLHHGRGRKRSWRCRAHGAGSPGAGSCPPRSERSHGYESKKLATGLAVDSTGPLFSTIVLFKNRIRFQPGFLETL